jgi:hypothetical protein
MAIARGDIVGDSVQVARQSRTISVVTVAMFSMA